MGVNMRIHTMDEAVHFVNERGFIFFWPGKDVPLPSLWNAVVGDRPVPNEHDDPGHITWDWKDTLLNKKLCYYGRVLDNRNTFISLDLLPYFYALSPNYGDYEYDYLDLYQEGQLTQQAKQIYEALLHEGPLDTLALRQSVRLSSSHNKNLFLKSLNELQEKFYILPVAISHVGGWRYAFVYDIPARYFENLVLKAKDIPLTEARIRLAKAYLTSVGAALPRFFKRMFQWKEDEIQHVISNLVDIGFCKSEVEFQDQPGKWIMINKIKLIAGEEDKNEIQSVQNFKREISGR